MTRGTAEEPVALLKSITTVMNGLVSGSTHDALSQDVVNSTMLIGSEQR